MVWAYPRWRCDIPCFLVKTSVGVFFGPKLCRRTSTAFWNVPEFGVLGKGVFVLEGRTMKEM